LVEILTKFIFHCCRFVIGLFTKFCVLRKLANKYKQRLWSRYFISNTSV